MSEPGTDAVVKELEDLVARREAVLRDSAAVLARQDAIRNSTSWRILEIYRKLFRYAELEGMTAMSARHSAAVRLYDRGADEDQFGLVLGISDRGAGTVSESAARHGVLGPGTCVSPWRSLGILSNKEARIAVVR